MTQKHMFCSSKNLVESIISNGICGIASYFQRMNFLLANNFCWPWLFASKLFSNDHKDKFGGRWDVHDT